ncbi:MAG: methyltransferase domain-containing protein [Bryobacteraceae bacterium]|jgi:SAM-dependent methyltransferase
MVSLRTIGRLRRMRLDWDRRARENARHFVVTHQAEWSDEEFFRSGEVAMEEDILNDLGNICQGKDPKSMRVIEIGCGAGRMTRALAGFFGEVHAVDISPEMVRLARRAVAGFKNASVYCNNGRDLRVLRGPAWKRLLRAAPPRFDFAFSSMVFQHIPSRPIVESYVRDVAALLRPGALFKFQVQGNPRVGIEGKNSWIGASFTEKDAREMADRCGFELRYQAGAGDQYYWLWFFCRG